MNKKLKEVIDNHLVTGIPLNNYSLSPDQLERMKVVVALYHAWKEDPFLEAERWLRVVKSRTPKQIWQDKHLFEYIKERKKEQLISVTDAKYMADRGIRRLFKASDQTGDMHTLDIAMKHLGKWHDPANAPEANNELPANIPVIFSTNIKDIAPDYEQVDKEKQLAILAKYGGKPDDNAVLVDRMVEELKQS